MRPKVKSLKDCLFVRNHPLYQIEFHQRGCLMRKDLRPTKIKRRDKYSMIVRNLKLKII